MLEAEETCQARQAAADMVDEDQLQQLLMLKDMIIAKNMNSRDQDLSLLQVLHSKIYLYEQEEVALHGNC